MSIRLSGFERKQLATTLKADIDAYCVSLYTDEYRDHLGASIIGEPCSRRLVYAYRWMAREIFDGRMLRLFNRGHMSEPRLIEWLRGIGCEVSEFADAENEKQHRMSNIDGHYGGSLDGQIQLPAKYTNLPRMLLEMKTHNDKSFKQLANQGVMISKPKHYQQMCAYGEAYKLDYGLYLAINKNDDNLWPEIVPLDHNVGKQLIMKADGIIHSAVLPHKIAANPAYSECKYCPMVNVCHLGKQAEVNCRSCQFSMPVENGQWFCSQWSAIIPHDEIPKACGQWQEFGK